MLSSMLQVVNIRSIKVLFRECLHESGLSFNPDRTHSVSVEIIRELKYICLHESGLSCNSFRIKFIPFLIPD